jgi:hypothetical protein
MFQQRAQLCFGEDAAVNGIVIVMITFDVVMSDVGSLCIVVR